MRPDSHKTNHFSDEDILLFLSAEMDEVDVIQFSLALKQNKNLQARVHFWRESLDFAGNLLQTYDNFMDMTLEIKDGFDLEEQGYQAPASAEWLPPRQATGR